MSLPTITARVAFNSDPLADTPTWTDLSDRLRTLRIRIGRTGDTADDFPPGSSSGVFKNADRALDPLDTAGTYYGKLTPGRRINYRVTHADVGTVDLFTGFVEDFPQDWFQPRYAETELTAVDGFSMLARTRAPASVWAYEIEQDSPKAWYRLGDNGIVVVDSSGNGHHGVYGLKPSSAESLVYGDNNGAATFVNSENSTAVLPKSSGVATLPISVEARVQFTDAPTFPEVQSSSIWSQEVAAGDVPTMLIIGLAPEYLTPMWWIGITGAVSASETMVVGQSYTITGTANASTMSLYVDGVEVDTSTSGALGTGANPRIGANAAVGGIPAIVDEVTIYDTELSAARVLAHHNAATAPWDGDEISVRIARYLDLAGWPSALRDLDVSPTSLGPAALGAAPLLNLIQQAARTDQGWFWQAPDGSMTLRGRNAPFTDSRAVTSQATFTDDPAAAGAYRYMDLILEPANVRQVRNIVTVNWPGGSVVERDDTSVDTYGPAEHTVDTICATENEARSLAQWQLLHYKDPATRVRGVVVAGKTGTWAAVLGLRLGDRVTIRRHPQLTHSAFTFDAYIEGIEHDISDGRTKWTTTFHLAPVEALSFWVLGTSALGTDTRLAY